ncbi:MAG: phosphomethylpyrimidine synthase ThiC, partial [Paludibacteraceae bacterium]|nr:phosphomethylpyrimidine synthase ThiC [Paludibacteraceae bacterium]
MNNTEKHAYAQREKVYLKGNLYPDIHVGMQCVHLTPTVTLKNEERIVTENQPVYIYDTGGPFTDPSMSVDYTKGITKIREPWIQRRAGQGTVKTQLAYAKSGIITEEMEYVAIRENMNIDKLGIKTHITPEFVRCEIAAGRAVLPANINHPE